LRELEGTFDVSCRAGRSTRWSLAEARDPCTDEASDQHVSGSGNSGEYDTFVISTRYASVVPVG
jgi:hypothetical protein